MKNKINDHVVKKISYYLYTPVWLSSLLSGCTLSLQPKKRINDAASEGYGNRTNYLFIYLQRIICSTCAFPGGSGRIMWAHSFVDLVQVLFLSLPRPQTMLKCVFDARRNKMPVENKVLIFKIYLCSQKIVLFNKRDLFSVSKIYSLWLPRFIFKL